MSTILHLTDLHLGLVKDEVLDDYKSDIVPLKQRVTRQKLLRHTLHELGQSLSVKGEQIDAIVITGDITTGNNEHGFELLQGLLDELGPCCPPKDHIVIIPGNHDVTWGTAPSTPEHYAYFMKHIRKNGFVTPLLDGIDFDDDELWAKDLTKHFLLDPNGEWVIVPINSANYCGSLEPLESITEDMWNSIPELLGKDNKEIKDTLRHLRRHDVARVSPRQLEVLQALLQTVDKTVKADGHDPNHTVRIGLVHHHLLPVSVSEEFKSFESITNLGLLRHFFRTNHFDVVLHGHKHMGLVYQDFIYDSVEIKSRAPHRLLVISGATIGDQAYRQSEIGRLLKINAQKYAPTLGIAPIAAIPLGSPHNFSKVQYLNFSLWQSAYDNLEQADRIHLLEGVSVSEVYARLMVLFNDRSANEQLSNVICQIENADSARALPDSYPDISTDEIDNLQQWLDDLVKWWQKRSSRLTELRYFNHGQRIRAFRGDIDQLHQAIEALSAKGSSSRAVITLLDPTLDKVQDPDHKFPSFCSVQFVIREPKSGSAFLDCIGYFRKQEFKYWWPVNVAELAQLQGEVFKELKSRNSPRGLELGTITTIAAIGQIERVLPRVSVPPIDRAYDEDQDSLWAMVYALFWSRMPGRSSYAKQWVLYLDGLIPPEEPDRDGIPVATEGLRFIIDTVKQFSVHHALSDVHSNLNSALKHLYELNSVHAHSTTSEQAKMDKHVEWRKGVIEDVKEIRTAIEHLLRSKKPGNSKDTN